jgi:hypothetical protein
MKYFDARPLIHDGDLIGTKKVHSLFGIFTVAFTGEYTHVGTAIWLEDGLWMAELNGGRNHVVPLSQLRLDSFDVFKPPRGIDRTRLKPAILEALRDTESYGFFTTIVTGIKEFFNIPITINWRKNRHCAGFCVSIYDRAGWGGHSYVVSPTALCSTLTMKLRVNNYK